MEHRSYVRKRGGGLSVLGASGAIHDMPRSDGIDLHSFYDARREPRVSKLQKYRALSRKLLAELSIEEEVPAPHRLHSRAPEPRSVLSDSEAIVNSPLDFVWVVGEEEQLFSAATILHSPQRNLLARAFSCRRIRCALSSFR